jgi:Zn-dependent protease
VSADLLKTIKNIVLYLVPMILSLSVHEFAHALVATKLGDDTPEKEERLTLSPAAHVDMVGTIIVPLISILMSGYAFIGWAKPVNINPTHFRRGVSMRGGMALSSAAGPLSNLLLAVLSAAVLTGLDRAGVFNVHTPGREGIQRLLLAMMSLNVGLCVFNLLPIPPLDGHRLLPQSADGLVAKMGQYSFLLIMLVVAVPALRLPLIDLPIQFLLGIISDVFDIRWRVA